MSEHRPTYQAGQQPTYRVTISYQLTFPDQAVASTGDQLMIQAHSADQAAVIGLAQLERFKPRKAIITQISMTVSLEI